MTLGVGDYIPRDSRERRVIIVTASIYLKRKSRAAHADDTIRNHTRRGRVIT